MSLLARIDAALLRRHQRACPWPTGVGAITTKGGYAAGGVVNTDRPMQTNFPLANVTRTKGATMARDERVGGTELRPCDLEALDGLIDVERLQNVANVLGKVITAYTADINEARSTLVDRQLAAQKALRDATHEVAALRLERDDLHTRLAERDAQVVALTKRLSEGQG